MEIKSTTKINDWTRCTCGSTTATYAYNNGLSPRPNEPVKCAKCGNEGHEISKVWDVIGVEWDK